MPEVSVILATHNNERSIGKAIQSAQNQTVQDIEIVVVDDASTDGTYAIMTSLAAHDSRIKCIHLPQNIGASGARNVALAKAIGQWITILDGDDWYELTRLENLLKAARDNEADLVADNIKIYDHIRQCVIYQTNFGKRNQLAALNAKLFFERDTPLQLYPIGFIQPLIRRKFLTDHNIVYDTTHRIGEDFIFVSEILLQGARAFIIPGAYYNYLIHISPTSLQKAPDSHLNVSAVLNSLIEGCDKLLQKHQTTMTSDARQALLSRLRLLESSAMFRTMRASLRDQRFINAARIVVTQPVILLLMVQNVWALLAANTSALLYPLTARD
jgi:succinoglycan biosynthesis protein ExoO